VFDDNVGQWVHQIDYRITHASSSDQYGTVYHRVDEGDRQGGWTTAVPANGSVSGSFPILPDNSVERIVVVESEEVTTGQVFDSNRVILLSSP
jgi:hypothetical protein